MRLLETAARRRRGTPAAIPRGPVAFGPGGPNSSGGELGIRLIHEDDDFLPSVNVPSLNNSDSWLFKRPEE